MRYGCRCAEGPSSTGMKGDPGRVRETHLPGKRGVHWCLEGDVEERDKRDSSGKVVPLGRWAWRGGRQKWGIENLKGIDKGETEVDISPSRSLLP